MIGYEEALQTILENSKVLEAEKTTVPKSMGQVAAHGVVSDIDLPQSDTARLDGYAARSSDLRAASRDTPVTLRVIGRTRAGQLTKKAVWKNTAVRIMTGSMIPAGADCVVRFEDTDEPDDKLGPNPDNPSTVKVFVAAAPGSGIRLRGSNIAKGSLVLAQGTILGPAQIATLLSVGKTRVTVVRRPVVTIIATGDELISPDRQLRPGKTFNSNAAALATLVLHYGGIPRVSGVARDNEASIVNKIQKGMTSDAIITSGGISHGDYDLMRLVLGKIGRVVFSRVKMGSGTGMVFSVLPRPALGGSNPLIPVFSLAGPPSGCLINFETLVRPALLKMRGMAQTKHPSVQATAVDTVANRKDIPCIKWTRLEEKEGRYRVMLNVAGTAGNLNPLLMANSLTIIPEGTMIRSGDAVRVLPLDWGCAYTPHKKYTRGV
ncbi:MAG: gephyrin-like molybdotransferase Glp [Syntrophorhabdaceae bacterium]|nr:molybdopterin molybdotransferase MoeA [Syntrophorhabdaceae bacterium]